MSSRGFSSFAGGGGPSFDGEISPEDLFNMFFGGGGPAFGGGGGFGGGPAGTQILIYVLKGETSLLLFSLHFF